MGTEASITVNQEGVRSFASALWNAQEYEIFIDDQKVGVLNGYLNHNTCAISSGLHSIDVRAYARDSASITRVYGYSQTLDYDGGLDHNGLQLVWTLIYTRGVYLP